MTRTTTGAYSITNIETGRKYIGGSKAVQDRWSHHRWALRSGVHHNAELQADWTRLGGDLFTFDVIRECDASALVEIEAEEIASALLSGEVYNLYLAATPQGYRHRPEFGAAQSARLTGRAVSDDTLAKMSAWKRNPETCARISRALTGKAKSVDHRAALSAAGTDKKLGPQSPETIAKRVAATARTKAVRKVAP